MRALRWWAVVVALSVAVAYGIVYGQNVAERIDRAESDRAALAQQVRDLGGTPVAGPKGSDGRDGRDGSDGRTGAPGPTGSPGLPGPTGSPGPVGPGGQQGLEGEKGQQGAVGPQGSAGPVGPQGPAGPPGDQGPPADACPEGYEGAIVVIEAQDYFLCRRVA